MAWGWEPLQSSIMEKYQASVAPYLKNQACLWCSGCDASKGVGKAAETIQAGTNSAGARV